MAFWIWCPARIADSNAKKAGGVGESSDLPGSREREKEYVYKEGMGLTHVVNVTCLMRTTP